MVDCAALSEAACEPDAIDNPVAMTTPINEISL
jgi:hypothetical protein